MHCQPCLCEKSHSICRVCRTGAVTSVVTSGFLAAAVKYTKPNYHSSSLPQNLQPCVVERHNCPCNVFLLWPVFIRLPRAFTHSIGIFCISDCEQAVWSYCQQTLVLNDVTVIRTLDFSSGWTNISNIYPIKTWNYAGHHDALLKMFVYLLQINTWCYRHYLLQLFVNSFERSNSPSYWITQIKNQWTICTILYFCY